MLTTSDIERLAARAGVRKTAVINFLTSLEDGEPSYAQRRNLQVDAREYRWNAATVHAINAGITKAHLP